MQPGPSGLSVVQLQMCTVTAPDVPDGRLYKGTVILIFPSDAQPCSWNPFKKDWQKILPGLKPKQSYLSALKVD